MTSLRTLFLFCYCGILWQCLQTNATGCAKLTTKDGFVCVCNASYCDTVPRLSHSVGVASVIESGESLGVMQVSQATFNQSMPSGAQATIRINSSVQYQELLGFGGAFTDAAVLNILSLSDDARTRVVESYYSNTVGIGYTVGRVPMASCDFSTHEYSYDDSPGDFDLVNFTLAAEDHLKIPLIALANKMAGRHVKLFGSPWSAPAWMKTNDNMSGRGSLKGSAGDKNHKTWATYFVRFLEEYGKNNLTFWGLTVQNEPFDGAIPDFPFQAMHFSAEMERDFVKMDLGPTLHAHGYGDIQLMILDDQRVFLPGFAKTVLSDPEAAKYVSGVAIHWYLDAVASSSDLDKTHESFPNLFILASEACDGSSPLSRGVHLGSWSRAEDYAHDIISDLNHWVVGWTDWNIALNMSGGPNWAHNYVDSPIIVEHSKDEFYKQPMYYALGHFSAFILPGSVRVNSELSEGFFEFGLNTVSFLTPKAISGLANDMITTVVLNKHGSSQSLVLHDPRVGNIEHVVAAHSIVTIQYLLP